MKCALNDYCSPLLCPLEMLGESRWSKTLAILNGLLFLLVPSRLVDLLDWLLAWAWACCSCSCCCDDDKDCVSVDTPGEMVGVAVTLTLLLLAVECCGEWLVCTGTWYDSQALTGEPSRRPIITIHYIIQEIVRDNCSPNIGESVSQEWRPESLLAWNSKPLCSIRSELDPVLAALKALHVQI